jgi:hypothetical protein
MFTHYLPRQTQAYAGAFLPSCEEGDGNFFQQRFRDSGTVINNLDNRSAAPVDFAHELYHRRNSGRERAD